MKRFFVYRLKMIKWLLLVYLLLAFLLTLGASALYSPSTVEGSKLDRLTTALPRDALMLGIRPSVTLAEHLVSSLYNLLFPCLSALFAFSLVGYLQLRPHQTGEMLYYTRIHRRCGAVVVVHFAVVVVAQALFWVVAFAAGALSLLLFQGSQLKGLMSMAGICFGGFCLSILPSGMALCGASTSGSGEARRWPSLLTTVFFLFMMLSRLDAPFSYLKWATPFSVYDAWALLRGRFSLPALLALPLAGGVFALIGSLYFSQREFI